MKYKDFKRLTEKEMKLITGGYVQECRASAKCANGSTISCNGISATTGAGGQVVVGCSAQDYVSGQGNGVVSCYQSDTSAPTGYVPITKNCSTLN